MLQFKVLIICPDQKWSTSALSFLGQGFIGDYASTGKEAQLKVYKGKYDYVFIDLATTNNSAIEVMRYIHGGHPGVRIFPFQITSDETCIPDDSLLRKMRIISVLKDFRPADILLPIKALGKIKAWQNLTEGEMEADGRDEGELSITDSQFTRIRIDEFFEDAVAIFDCYIRVGSDRYVKIIHKGERSSSEQIKRYSENGVKFLYFLSQDRADFIGYQNELTSQLLKNDQINEGKVLKAMKSAVDKYIEEAHVQGIQPQLIEEGKAICKNVYDFVQKDTSLKKILNNFEEFNPASYSHSFLVSFFCAVITKNMDWVGERTREALSIGALFHDIGHMEIPEAILMRPPEQLSPDELLIYKQHPEKGIASLEGIPSINNTIKQIVLQHHEANDGTGYPVGLSASRIFPLAKILSLADGFSEFIMQKECTPLDGIKEFLTVRDHLVRYDSDLVRSLVKGFVSEKK
ncbi:MAG: HD-GYP domain-containing protein [Bacteriovoracia bacterium]